MNEICQICNLPHGRESRWEPGFDILVVVVFGVSAMFFMLRSVINLR